MRRTQCRRPAEKCSVASAIRSTPPTSVPTCCRRKPRGRRSSAFANGGGDMINAIEQANEFGLTARRSELVVACWFSFPMFIAWDLPTAQGLEFVTGFLLGSRRRDPRLVETLLCAASEACRPWHKPSVYSAIRHYLRPSLPPARTKPRRSWPKCGTFRSTISMPKRPASRRRPPGPRHVFRAEVKTPSELKEPWDYYKILGIVPGVSAFRSLEDGGCPLVRR